MFGTPSVASATGVDVQPTELEALPRAQRS